MSISPSGQPKTFPERHTSSGLVLQQLLFRDMQSPDGEMLYSHPGDPPPPWVCQISFQPPLKPVSTTIFII